MLLWIALCQQNNFGNIVTVMGPEGGTVKTCFSHAQDGKVNMDIYDAVRHQQTQSMSQTSSQPRPIGQEPDRSQSMPSVRKISIPGWPPPRVMVGVHHHPYLRFLTLHRFAIHICS